MNVSSWAIKSPIPSIVFFILLTFAGLTAFKMNGVQDFPDIELPMVTVSASLPGAAPAQLETEVARKIENSVASLQGVKHIYTNILDGVATITIEFVLEKNASDAANEVRDAVSQVRADLPADLRDPVISKAATAGRPIMTYAVSSTGGGDEEAVSWFIDNTVTKRILNVPGVGKVARLGGVTRELQVILDQGKMSALGVTAADVSQQLKRVQQETPGGRGDVGGAEQTVRTIATVKSLAELSGIDIPLRDGRRVRLDQVADVQDTVAEQRALALLDGKRVVAFEISRTRGASEVTVAQAVRKAVDELKAAHPSMQIEEAIDNVWPVEENFEGSMHLLYEGALLAVIVVWFFLRDWRSTFVAAAALPLSLIPTFLGLYWFGFTLNTVTLLSLALVVGILVDDAIVEIENIERHMRMGKTPYQAAMEAADEIGLAVIATTFALIAVFLPTAFMAGIPGKFFKQFGWAAVLAIFASLVVARMLTPMMAAYILKPKPHVETADGPVMTRYLQWVRWCVQHRHLTAIFSAVFFIGSLSLIPLLPTGFVPPADRALTLVNIELPPGSTLKDTLEAAERARAVVKEVKEVKSVFSSVGGGVSGDAFAIGVAPEARKAALNVNLVHRNDRGRDQQAVEADIRARLASQPGVRVTVGPQDTGVKMQLVLQSENPEALIATARELERDLRTLQGVGNVSSTASLTRPEILVKPDFARAADLGVSTDAIGETVRVATTGDYSQFLPKFNLAERQIPIRVKLADASRADLAAIERIQIPGKAGPVMLNQVATLSMDAGPAQIDRLDRCRQVTFDVELGSRQLGDVYAEAMQLPAMKKLPPGVRQAELGDTQMMEELFASFGLAMTIGVLCIYAVLVLLFRDFLQPVTILAALPLSIGGAFILLLLTGKSFSMPSLIGLLALMGIVTKNSILLVEYAIVARRDHGLSRIEAIVDACHKRARPIIMTTLAMGFGMLPIAMGFGADPSFRSPMAVAVIGGLVTSTLLSLLVVPAVYTYVDDAEGLVKRLYARITGVKAAKVQEPTAAE
ncbi:MAG: efflux RND transporter permease subunit [Betaproteobacteria bacterium]|nr:efflux RND transporter permease subunit [Betaproteobacteria bacterium]